jgi:hypothetical protein
MGGVISSTALAHILTINIDENALVGTLTFLTTLTSKATFVPAKNNLASDDFIHIHGA